MHFKQWPEPKPNITTLTYAIMSHVLYLDIARNPHAAETGLAQPLVSSQTPQAVASVIFPIRPPFTPYSARYYPLRALIPPRQLIFSQNIPGLFWGLNRGFLLKGPDSPLCLSQLKARLPAQIRCWLFAVRANMSRSVVSILSTFRFIYTVSTCEASASWPASISRRASAAIR